MSELEITLRVDAPIRNLPAIAEVLNSALEREKHVVVWNNQPTKLLINPGKYLVSARLPSGRLIRQMVDLPTKDSVALVVLEASDELQVWSPMGQIRTPFSVMPLPSATAGNIWLLLWGWKDGAWQCEHWRGEPPKGDQSGMHAELSLPTDRVWLLQVGGDTVPHRFVAIPPSTEIEILVIGTRRDNDSNGGVSVRTLTRDPEAEALLHYESFGAIESAALLGESIALRSTRAKSQDFTSDPNGILLGFYSLLRNQRLTSHFNLTESLAQSVQWLPDASVISAMSALAMAPAKKKGEAKDLLVRASASALPVYTRGFRTLFDQLAAYKQDPQTSHDDAIDYAFERLSAYALATDWKSIWTTFLGAEPSHPSREFVFGPSQHLEAIYLDFVTEPDAPLFLSSTDPEESRLIGEIRDQQSREAFGKLVSLHNKELVGYLRGRCRRKDDAEDIAQEAWVMVLDKIHQFDSSRGNFIAFLKYLAQITALRWNRSNPNLLTESTLITELEDIYPVWTRNVGWTFTTGSNPEDWLSVQQQYMKLLRLIFQTTSPPHQLLAFAFCRILSWEPRRFVRELSEQTLDKVEESFRAAFAKEIPMEADVIKQVSRGLKADLQRTFEEAIEDPATQAAYADLAKSIIGQTLMKQYFRHHPEQNVSHWIYAVRRRALADWAKKKKL